MGADLTDLRTLEWIFGSTLVRIPDEPPVKGDALSGNYVAQGIRGDALVSLRLSIPPSHPKIAAELNINLLMGCAKMVYGELIQKVQDRYQVQFDRYDGEWPEILSETDLISIRESAKIPRSNSKSTYDFGYSELINWPHLKVPPRRISLGWNSKDDIVTSFSITQFK